MKPTAAETLKLMLSRKRARRPPTSAKGRLVMTTSALVRDPKAEKSMRNISAIETGTTMESRFMARS